LTPPTPPPRTPIHTVCPACGKGHDDHPEFGAYCNLTCLTAATLHWDPVTQATREEREATYA